jgi:hypothetical protein
MKTNKCFGKLLTSLLLVSTLVFAFASCSSDDDAAAELAVSTSTITISQDGQSTFFQISSNTDWVISGNPGWLTVSPVSGSGNKAISVVAGENTQVSPRNSQLIVTTSDGSLSRTIQVTQEAATAQLLVNGSSSATMHFAAEGNETQQISITANAEWEITNIPSWIRVSPSNGSGNSTLSITVTEDNFSDEDRSNALTISGAGASASIMVSQVAELAKNLRVELSNLTIMYDGFAADLTFSDATKGYREAFFTASAVASLTERDIYNKLMEQTEYSTLLDYTISNITDEGTELVYCVAAYGDENKSDGQHKYGPMSMQRITTRTYSYADVMYMSLSYTSTSITITTSRLGKYGQKCDDYYILAYSSSTADLYEYFYDVLPSAYFAHFNFKPMLESETALDHYKNQPQTIYYTRRTDVTSFFCMTWGINRDTKEFAAALGTVYKSFSSSLPQARATAPASKDWNNPELRRQIRECSQRLEQDLQVIKLSPITGE